MSYIPRFGSRGSDMLSVGFVVTPGFPVMSLAALSVFEFANFSAKKKLYDIQVLSEDGGPFHRLPAQAWRPPPLAMRISTR